LKNVERDAGTRMDERCQRRISEKRKIGRKAERIKKDSGK
jgi:hypothetical protein